MALSHHSQCRLITLRISVSSPRHLLLCQGQKEDEDPCLFCLFSAFIPAKQCMQEPSSLGCRGRQVGEFGGFFSLALDGSLVLSHCQDMQTSARIDDPEGPIEAAEDENVARRQRERAYRRTAVDFLCRQPDHLNEFYIFRVALSAEISFMRAILKQNEPVHDVARMELTKVGDHKGALQQLRILKTLSWGDAGGPLHEAFAKSMDRLTDEDTWQHLPHTEFMASCVMRYMLRPLAVYYELVWKRIRSYPLQLFRLLQEPSFAEHLMRVRTRDSCLFDQFSQAFVDMYDTAEKLQSTEASAVLTMQALQVVGNTHHTETLHSRNLRKARSRHQTHEMKLHHLGLWHQASAAPLWLPSQVPLKKQRDCFSASREKPIGRLTKKPRCSISSMRVSKIETKPLRPTSCKLGRLSFAFPYPSCPSFRWLFGLSSDIAVEWLPCQAEAPLCVNRKAPSL